MWWHAELQVEGRVIDTALEQVVLKIRCISSRADSAFTMQKVP